MMTTPLSSVAPASMPAWPRLERYDIVLGSQSPRRVELLRGLDLRFRQEAMPDIDERVPQEGRSPRDIALEIAERKRQAYTGRMQETTLLITADTIVVAPSGEILGKPTDRADAERMLRLLSQGWHEVLTAVTISTLERVERLVCSTEVWLSELSAADIAYYLDRYEPYDKAGAYGIQEWVGYRAIREIRGSFYNVMGLPVHRLAEVLATF